MDEHTVNALLQRLANLKGRLAASNLLNTDRNVQFWFPGAEFTPSEDMVETYVHLEADFFRHPLSDSDRRKFLFNGSKNSTRNYDLLKFTNDFIVINFVQGYAGSFTWDKESLC